MNGRWLLTVSAVPLLAAWLGGVTFVVGAGPVGHGDPFDETPTATMVVTPTVAATAVVTVTVVVTREVPVVVTATPGPTERPSVVLFEPVQPDGLVDALYAPIEEDGSWGDWRPFLYLGGGTSGGRELPAGPHVVLAACGVPIPLPTDEPTPTTAPATATPWIVTATPAASARPRPSRLYLPFAWKPRVRR